MNTIDRTNDISNSTMTADDAKRLESLYQDVADAKRAPELAVWVLALGPVTIDELVAMRQEATGCGADYARMSVMHDLGRIAGLGGPVECRGELFYFNDEHKRAVLAWVYDFQVAGVVRTLSRFDLGVQHRSSSAPS